MTLRSPNRGASCCFHGKSFLELRRAAIRVRKQQAGSESAAIILLIVSEIVHTMGYMESADRSSLRLADFILQEMEEILEGWEDYARRYWVGPAPDSTTLRNHAEGMLRAVAADIETRQSPAQQQAKSEGEYTNDPSQMNEAALGHALARINDGFDVERMVAEFRALRASVSRLWLQRVPAPDQDQAEELGRFNEALDQLIATSIGGFTKQVDQGRRLFLGIIGHDLRQPVYSLRMCADILSRGEQNLGPESRTILASMANSCDSLGRMLNDLLDFTTSQLGVAIPLNRARTNLEQICREVMAEISVVAFDTDFRIECTGDTVGTWDGGRLKQLMSNLLSNAAQHGARAGAIRIGLVGDPHDVLVTVNNHGSPIPQDSVRTIFDPLVRAGPNDGARPAGSMGLGLYICRQIAAAHGGEIGVDSSIEDGTTFTVKLPKQLQAEVGNSLHL